MAVMWLGGGGGELGGGWGEGRWLWGKRHGRCKRELWCVGHIVFLRNVGQRGGVIIYDNNSRTIEVYTFNKHT